MNNDKLALSIDNMTTHQEISLVRELISNYGLTAYIKLILDEYKFKSIEESYEHSHFKFRYIHMLLAYEAAIYQRLNNFELKQLLVIAFFINRQYEQKAYDMFMYYHEQLKPTQRLPNEMLDVIVPLIKKKINKERSIFAKIMKDILVMVPYSVDENFKKEQYEILIDYERDYGRAQTETRSYLIHDVFNRLFQQQWLTRWAELKAYKLNWPEVLKKDKEALLAM